VIHRWTEIQLLLVGKGCMGKRCAKLDERPKNTYNQQNSGEFQTASVTNEFAIPDKKQCRPIDRCRNKGIYQEVP
jgi:hypothetical protein